MMRVLRVHNAYRELGGEDRVFEAETALLLRHGMAVSTLRVSNDSLPTARTIPAALHLATSTVWSRMGYQQVSEAVRSCQPQVVHFDNTFPLVSPAAYSAARVSGAAVVQTLHNYRLLCPNALLFRDNHPCQDCLGKTPPVPAVIHACYRGSRAHTMVVATMLTAHRVRRTWSRDVDRYIALTEFARAKFIEGGLPEDRISLKPNFVDGPLPVNEPRGNQFLFVGRLSPEKGIHTMLQAQVRHQLPLRIAGDGPLAPLIRQFATSESSLTMLGSLPRDQVASEMTRALALVFPSEWYEGFPVTVVEAFANGLPVIAFRRGAMAELVEDGSTGLLLDPGAPDELAAVMTWASNHPAAMRQMGLNARKVYEAKYTPQRNYEVLAGIYAQAIAHRRGWQAV